MDYALGHSIQNEMQMRYFMATMGNCNWNLVNDVKQCWSQPGDKTKYAAYAGLADLYDQPVSADLVVRGYNQANMTEETVTGSDGKRETIQVSTPKSETISVTFTLSGNGALWMDTTTLSDLPEGTTVYDVLQRLQKDGKLTFRHKGGYISSITFGDKTLTGSTACCPTCICPPMA